jgi:WD40 repeat protein
LVSSKFTIEENTSEIFSSRISPDDTMLAVSHANGMVKLYTVDGGDEMYHLNGTSKDDHPNSHPYPITCLKWKPFKAGELNSHFLMAVCADGSVLEWCPRMEDKMEKVLEIKDNNLLCFDFNHVGSKFALAGKMR